MTTAQNTARSNAPGLEWVPCNLCGEHDARPLWSGNDVRYKLDDSEWNVVQCRRCELVYLNPRPTAESMWRHYPARFYENRDVSRMAERYRLQSAVIDRFPRGRLLDIGCANGDWIETLRAEGWDVDGIEGSPHAGNPHGLRIRRGSFPDSADWPDGSFDVATAWAVFEHLHDPTKAFREAARLLRPNGRLVILVTNARSFSSRYGYTEDIPRHLYFFSERSLAGYAAKSGLRLDDVNHDTRFFGGGARGVLQVQLFRQLGWSPSAFFDWARRPRAERIAAHPAASALLLATGMVERLMLPDWLVCRLRLSGIIIASFTKVAS